jgi:alpha-glucuronidase
MKLRFFQGLLLLIFASAISARAETGYEAWLRYAPIEDTSVQKNFEQTLPAVVVTLGKSELEQSSQKELLRGIRGMVGRTERIEAVLPDEDAIVLGTFDEIKNAVPSFATPPDVLDDGFCLKTISSGGHKFLIVTAPNDRGVLYGTFTLLRKIGLQESLSKLEVRESPYATIRAINQWDELSGEVLRGYAGKSIFWANGHVVKDLTRVNDYARLLASLGINGCSINNVNADPRFIQSE